MAEGRPRILITGTYCSLNRGDAAMQLACARGLRERIPDAQLAIHAPFPEIDGPFYEARGLPVVGSTRRRLARGSFRWARMTWRGLHSAGDANTPTGPYPPNSETDAIEDADLVVDLSGDMLTEDYGIHVAYSHFLPLLQTLAADVPLAVCAQSVGPFRWTVPLARRILEGADLVTLREGRSLEHLRAHGIEARRLEITADLAFALPPADDADVDAALAAEGVPADSAWIGVSHSGLVEQHRRRRGGAGTLADQLIPALTSFADDTGLDILLVPHVFGPKPVQDDRLALETFRTGLGERARLLRSKHPPEVLKGIIGRSTLFIGARMHAVMAALSTAVPVVALAYSHKAVGIMADFGMEDWVLDSAEVERAEIASVLRALADARPRLVGTLEARAESARTDAMRNFDLLETLLDRGNA